jgi:hypothetical protein
MGLFKWHSAEAGERIERYLTVLCTETPAVAKELLTTPIKNTNQWLSDVNGVEINARGIQRAECGCLMGATLMALLKVHPTEMKELEAALTTTGATPSALHRGLLAVDGDFGGLSRNDIEEIGHDVMHEVRNAIWDRYAYEDEVVYKEAWAERERVVVFHIKNQIRKNLGIPQLTRPE